MKMRELTFRLRRTLILVWLLFFLLLFAACDQTVEVVLLAPEPTPEAPVSERGRGDTLQIIFWEAPTTLNPHLAGASKDLEAIRITYEPLASYDHHDELVPILAAEIPTLENGGLAADGRSVTWKLRRDVLWSDGAPFTAADVLFTYDYVMNPEIGSYSAFAYLAIDRIERVDDYTVRLHFVDINAAWSLPFVGFWGMILPQHVFADYNGPNAREAPANDMPIGTGAYRVVAFKPQEVLFLGTELVETNKIVFEPNPYFREEDKPYFRQVVLRGGGIVTEAARAALTDGRADYAYNLTLSTEDLERLGELTTGEIRVNLTPWVVQIALNHTDPNRETADGERSSRQYPHPFFSDRRVRQAFNYAMDRDTIAGLYEGVVPTSNVLVAPEIYNSPNTSYEYNLEKAAALLDEAGWVDSDGDGIRDKDGRKMSVLFQTAANPLYQQIQEIIRNSLEQIGVEVQIRIVDASILYSGDPANPNTLERFQADMQMFPFATDSPNADLYMQTWTCAQIPQRENDWLAGYNYGRWCHFDYDALLEETVTELDPGVRRRNFIQLNDMLIHDVVMIPLIVQGQVSGFSPTIENVVMTIWDGEMWNIKDWRRTSTD
jgi:peptide/nickel transport system substrate-binding protein